jgi:hypothetical protein
MSARSGLSGGVREASRVAITGATCHAGVSIAVSVTAIHWTASSTCLTWPLSLP